MSFKKYATLFGVVLFGACGDVCLSRGMKQVGEVSFAHWTLLFSALANPWVILGIVLLLGFFTSYLTALSFADLTYVLPATSVGYILMALLAKFFLHEQISPVRWVGILLISAGVGFVTQGPAKTDKRARDAEACAVGAEAGSDL